MHVKVDKSGTISVPDNLSDDSISKFWSVLREWLDKKPTRVLLNCSALEHATSSHVNLLWQTKMLCRERSVALLLKLVPDNLISVLKVLDLYEEFEFDTYSVPDTPSRAGAAEQVNDGKLKMEFRVDSISISAKLIEFREFLEKIRTPSESIVELETIFYEVVTNIRLHSGLGPQDAISFHALSNRSRISLEFIDSGVPFNPTEQDVGFEPKAAMREGKRRGFGLIMISRMSESMSYERRDGNKNVLTVIKQWSNR